MECHAVCKQSEYYKYKKIAEEQNKDISICYYNRFYYKISGCLYIIRKLTYGFRYKDKKPELSMFLIGKPILKLKDMNAWHKYKNKNCV